MCRGLKGVDMSELEGFVFQFVVNDVPGWKLPADLQNGAGGVELGEADEPHLHLHQG